MGWDVKEIQREHFATWVGRPLLAIIEMPNGTFEVYKQSPTSVFPPHDYPTMRKAVTRLLQLAGTGAVAPQTWPEETCIGHIEVNEQD